jgi:hypothetical protein
VRVEKDHSVFVHKNGSVIGLYVDDLLILTPTVALMEQLKEQLSARFRVKDLGEISHYLGMKIRRSRQNRTIYMNQASYINKILTELGMEHYRRQKTPIDPLIQLRAAADDYVASKEDSEGFRKLIGCLQWLITMTRPDIAYTVSIYSRYSKAPLSTYDTVLKRIISYLARIIELGLRYGPKEGTEGLLVGFIDSS